MSREIIRLGCNFTNHWYKYKAVRKFHKPTRLCDGYSEIPYEFVGDDTFPLTSQFVKPFRGELCKDLQTEYSTTDLAEHNA
jgi:hypothetical protein